MLRIGTDVCGSYSVIYTIGSSSSADRYIHIQEATEYASNWNRCVWILQRNLHHRFIKFGRQIHSRSNGRTGWLPRTRQGQEHRIGSQFHLKKNVLSNSVNHTLFVCWQTFEATTNEMCLCFYTYNHCMRAWYPGIWYRVVHLKKFQYDNTYDCQYAKSYRISYVSFLFRSVISMSTHIWVGSGVS